MYVLLIPLIRITIFIRFFFIANDVQARYYLRKIIVPIKLITLLRRKGLTIYHVFSVLDSISFVSFQLRRHIAIFISQSRES